MISTQFCKSLLDFHHFLPCQIWQKKFWMLYSNDTSCLPLSGKRFIFEYLCHFWKQYQMIPKSIKDLQHEPLCIFLYVIVHYPNSLDNRWCHFLPGLSCNVCGLIHNNGQSLCLSIPLKEHISASQLSFLFCH